MTTVAPLTRGALELISSRRRAFLILASASVGAFLIGVLATLFVPALRPGGLGALQGGADAPGVGSLITDAYRSGNVAYAALITFAVNLLLASLLQTTLPTLVVPFLGVGLTLIRSLSWGILFTPFGSEDPTFLIHWVTLAIEGTAYLVVGFAAWIQGTYFLQPHRFGFTTRRTGYLAGLVATARLYIVVVILLVIGAIYEAISVIYFIA